MGKNIVGCRSIIFRERPPHIDHLENSLRYIHRMYIDGEYRKKVISSAIMARLHEEARKQGMHKTGLHASRSGSPIYGSTGYKASHMYLEFEPR